MTSLVTPVTSAVMHVGSDADSAEDLIITNGASSTAADYLQLR